MAQDRKSFLIRIDPALHTALQQWADEELRSLNGQIEFLLKEALKRAKRDKTSSGVSIDEQES